ncbi:11070_t:CDS:2, partial [Diversispora eburnea]
GATLHGIFPPTEWAYGRRLPTLAAGYMMAGAPTPSRHGQIGGAGAPAQGAPATLNIVATLYGGSIRFTTPML